jgi:hypothetical protein
MDAHVWRNKIVKNSQLPPRAGAGRPKNAKNKLTREVKQMILDALAAAGGVKYLTKQATANPKAFLTLVGKVLPLQVTGEGGGPIQIVMSNTDADL